MKTLTRETFDKWPDMPAPASARGISGMLDTLAKNEGRGGDLLLSPDLTVSDIAKAYMDMTFENMGGNEDDAA